MARRVFMSVGKAGMHIAVEAAASGVIGGGISYLVLKRDSAVRLFGLNMPDFVADGLLIAVGSASGDIIGAYAVPMIESKLIGNPQLETLFKHGLPPLLSAAVSASGKRFFVRGGDYDMATDVLLGAGSKLGANYVSSMMGY